MDNRLVILLYHDLVEDESALPTEAYLRDRAITRNNFQAQMQHLVDEGYQSLTMEEYFACRENHRPLPEKSVIITFDDGFRSHYEIGYRILSELGLKGTFFVVGSWIDRSGFLNREQLREMHEGGMEIGSHGHTHTFLAYLSKDEVYQELKESKDALEQTIGARIDHFAYPGGHYKRWMWKQLKETGYKGASSCLYGWNDVRSNPYLLRRVDIRQRMDISAFAAVFDNNNMQFYQGVYFVKRLVRGLIGRRGYTRLRRKFYRFYRLQR
jgi:peptidoglycan/xylan/chitin deacetylase (PgdA/CDA1 family)